MFTKYSALWMGLIFGIGSYEETQGYPRVNPSQFIKIGRGSYYMDTVAEKNWFAAYESCRQMKASLIAFESLGEWKLVNQYLQDMQIARKYWTAGTDWAEQGKHVWFSTGQPLSLDIWREGEPNNYQGDERCVEAGPTTVPYLNDIVCTTQRMYICEADMKEECPKESLKTLILIKEFYPGS